MPHVIVKLVVGRFDQTKSRIAEAITKVIVANADCDVSAVSVSFEDVAPADWAQKVYKPDILGHWDQVYKKPGYNPL